MAEESRSLFYIPSGGTHISVCLHLPLASRADQRAPWPYVILCHGFLGNKTGRYRYQVELSEKLALRGIASIRFDYRGCGDSFGHPQEIGFFDAVSDTLSVLEWAQSQNEIIDPSRSILWGRSYGGMVVTHALARTRSMPKAAIIQAPMFDAAFWLNNAQVGSAQMNAGALFFKGEPVSQKLVQELLNLDSTKALEASLSLPFLIISHENDEVVLPDHVDKYLDGRKKSLRTDLIRLEDANHECSNYEARQRSLSLTVDWIARELYV